jgi:hypothetical protein
MKTVIYLIDCKSFCKCHNIHPDQKKLNKRKKIIGSQWAISGELMEVCHNINIICQCESILKRKDWKPLFPLYLTIFWYQVVSPSQVSVSSNPSDCPLCCRELFGPQKMRLGMPWCGPWGFSSSGDYLTRDDLTQFQGFKYIFWWVLTSSLVFYI